MINNTTIQCVKRLFKIQRKLHRVLHFYQMMT